MHEDTGEIRPIEQVPKNDRKWSDAFHKGEILTIKGIKMEIIDIKQLRGHIVLGCRTHPVDLPAQPA